MLRAGLITVGSREHRLALELRRQVLRKPLGLGALSAAELELEPRAVHMGCFASMASTPHAEDLVGTLLLQVLAPGTVQMRQVAVAEAWQGQGVGRALVREAEAWCRHAPCAGKVCQLFAHAREAAVPFYLKLDYRLVGDGFEEVGIPHRRVEKVLKASDDDSAGHHCAQ